METEEEPPERGLGYNILAPAKRSACDITTAMRTALPVAHARDDIRSTTGENENDETDGREKKRNERETQSETKT